MASHHPSNSEPETANPPMCFNSLKRVIGTGWGEAARPRAHPGKGYLVEPMKSSGDRTPGSDLRGRLTHERSPTNVWGDIPLTGAPLGPRDDNHRSHSPGYHDGRPRPYQEVL
jgi:hypothetical protein